MYAKKADFLKPLPFKTAIVTVNDMHIKVREMSGIEKAKWEAFAVQYEKKGNEVLSIVDRTKFRIAMFIFSVCDENNKLLFTVDDVPELENSLTSEVLVEVSNAAIVLNNSGGSQEEQLKNSEGDLPANSSLS
jgi:short-subunit dehydrogenase involved in D-alanine esterification of teichoic acids